MSRIAKAPVLYVVILLLLVSAAPACRPKPAERTSYDLPLADGWFIRSSAEVQGDGAAVSGLGLDKIGRASCRERV